jgi:hypothetical protein
MPECGTENPEPGWQLRRGSGDDAGIIFWQSTPQYTTCRKSEYGKELVRNPEANEESLRRWRLDR